MKLPHIISPRMMVIIGIIPLACLYLGLTELQKWQRTRRYSIYTNSYQKQATRASDLQKKQGNIVAISPHKDLITKADNIVCNTPEALFAYSGSQAYGSVLTQSGSKKYGLWTQGCIYIWTDIEGKKDCTMNELISQAKTFFDTGIVSAEQMISVVSDQLGVDQQKIVTLLQSCEQKEPDHSLFVVPKDVAFSD